MLAGLIFLSFAAVAGSFDPGTDPAWLRYLQFSGGSSAITTPEFFLSPDGRTDARAEWQRSVAAFRAGESRSFEGILRPLSCQFPARALLIERLSGERLPSPACPELEPWKKALGDAGLSVLFAGAYANNPASLFGHTFLRFHPGAVEDRSDRLLSYSAGFLASTDAGDNQAVTIVKGLLGFYLGTFNVKPHYMNAALYNNGESRDLWEYPLKLSRAEVAWASMYLWELSHFAGMPYYFAGANCSYRLLSFLQAVRPSLDLESRTGFFVVPVDTLRVLRFAGLVDEANVSYEPSLRTRLNARWSALSSNQRAQFRAGRRSLAALERIRDPAVLDALLEDWTGRNYDARTLLSTGDQALYDRTAELRASVGGGVAIDPAALRPGVRPDEGHLASWVEGATGPASTGGGFSTNGAGWLSSRWGTHDLKWSSRGYDDSATIEYIGLDVLGGERLSRAELLLGDVAALNPWSTDFGRFSWRGDGRIRVEKDARGAWVSGLDTGGGFGLSWAPARGWLIFFLPSVRAWLAFEPGSRLGVGGWGGFRFEAGAFSFVGEASVLASREGSWGEGSVRGSYFATVSRSYFLEFREWQREGVRTDFAGLGLRQAF